MPQQLVPGMGTFQPGATIASFMYQLFVFVAFFMIYMSLDFRSHFRVPDDMKGKPISAITKFYYAGVTQFGLGYGDITPKTDVSRMVAVIHAFLAWAVLMVVFT